MYCKLSYYLNALGCFHLNLWNCILQSKALKTVRILWSKTQLSKECPVATALPRCERQNGQRRGRTHSVGGAAAWTTAADRCELVGSSHGFLGQLQLAGSYRSLCLVLMAIKLWSTCLILYRVHICTFTYRHAQKKNLQKIIYIVYIYNHIHLYEIMHMF